MRSLLIKGSILVFLALASLLAIYLSPMPYKDRLSAILNKREMLMDGRRNRIIFVGGSGLYCGLDSDMIEKRLQRPVVNMGLYYGFGIIPLLNEIRPYLHAGDTVVVIPEYKLIFDQYDDLSRKWVYALSPGKNFFPVYQRLRNPFKMFLEDMNGLVHSKLEAISSVGSAAFRAGRFVPVFQEGYVFYAQEFNAHGDSLIGFPNAKALQGKGEDFFSESDFGSQSFTALSTFCLESKRQNVSCFFMFPAFAAKDYRRMRGAFHQYEQRLRKELNCGILGTAEDFIYPDQFFSDSVNHLNAEGKRKRTETVLRLLQNSRPLQAVRTAPGALRPDQVREQLSGQLLSRKTPFNGSKTLAYSGEKQ